MEPLSFTGRRWKDNPTQSGVDQLASMLSLPPVVAQCVATRTEGQPADDWLTPDRSSLHDPYAMAGMAAAVERLQQACRDNQHIRIVTDYDVDGTTSSLLLQETMRLGGAKHIDYHIPHRFHEGYGFSERAAQQAVEDGVDLLITADIGVRDHQAVTMARAGGVDVIICDHHLPSGASVPTDANVVLCPPQQGCNYPNPHLAACGVSFKVAQAMLAKHPKRDAILDSMLKIAAIGTVADVVDLASLENRAIVSMGLAGLNQGRHGPGLSALLEVCELQPGRIDSSDLGFRIGPRINAAGRIDDAKTVVRLFAQKKIEGAREVAQQLDAMNRERRDIQRKLVDTCLEQVKDAPPPFVVLDGIEAEGWHRGVIGIVAARVRDTIHRPVAIIAVAGDEGRGSVRSIPSVHAVRALDAAEDLLERYGGHPAAAGFSIKAANVEALRERLATYVNDQVDAEALVPELHIDGRCHARDIGWSLVNSLLRLAPYGKGNPEPLLRVTVEPRNVRVFSERHLKFSTDGAEAIWWNAAEHCERLQGPVEIAARPGIHSWQGRRSLRLTVEDARPC